MFLFFLSLKLLIVINLAFFYFEHTFRTVFTIHAIVENKTDSHSLVQIRSATGFFRFHCCALCVERAARWQSKSTNIFVFFFSISFCVIYMDRIWTATEILRFGKFYFSPLWAEWRFSNKALRYVDTTGAHIYRGTFCVHNECSDRDSLDVCTLAIGPSRVFVRADERKRNWQRRGIC